MKDTGEKGDSMCERMCVKDMHPHDLKSHTFTGCFKHIHSLYPSLWFTHFTFPSLKCCTDLSFFQQNTNCSFNYSINISIFCHALDIVHCQTFVRATKNWQWNTDKQSRTLHDASAIHVFLFVDLLTQSPFCDRHLHTMSGDEDFFYLLSNSMSW